MKVLHININDYMGAGLFCFRINKALQNEGIDSKMLVLHKKSKDSSVYNLNVHTLFIYKVINRLLSILPFKTSTTSFLYKVGKQKKTIYSRPTSHIDLSSHPLVKEADLIHLHWIGGMLDYPTFFSNVDKPIVWTLHDENLFYGVAHYAKDILNNDVEKKYYEIKKKSIYKIKKFGVVFLSKLFYETFSQHEMIKNAQKTIINNSVDTSKFRPINTNSAKQDLGLDRNTVYLLFIAYDITETRKGLAKLIKAVGILNKKIKILAIGKCNNFTGDANVITLGSINDIKRLRLAISASDYFVMPSSQEAFAQTPLEAMACGKPAIVFPVSGMDELITGDNGVICNGFTVKDLVDGCKRAFEKEFDSKEIREDIKKRFSPQIIAQKYIDFYQKILQK